jgi:carbon-monoxide dehydrogenase small subunit
MRDPGERITLSVNGRDYDLIVSPTALLMNVLRDQLGLTGTKYACGIGECGACSVLVDGELTLSCLTLVETVAGHRVETVESLADTPLGRALTRAILDHAGVQCGFCTPGMVVAGVWRLNRLDHALTEEEARDALRGNLCRCTGYAALVAALQDASETLAEIQAPRTTEASGA